MSAPAGSIFRGMEADFQRAAFTGKNESGFRPLGKSVLILSDTATGKTMGGITIPDEHLERMNIGSETGAIIAVGAEAFSHFEDGTRWTDYKPKPGDRVVYERYAGRLFLGVDGQTYRLMTYTCIGGLEVLENPTPSSKKKGGAKTKSKG